VVSALLRSVTCQSLLKSAELGLHSPSSSRASSLLQLTATPVGARLPAMTSEHSLQNLIETHSMARDAAILRTPPNERREAEWRCRGVGRSAWMPSERRWAMDGPSARAHTTVPERRDPWEPGAGRQRKMVSPLCRNKGGRPSGRNQNSAAQQILMVPPDQKV